MARLRYCLTLLLLLPLRPARGVEDDATHLQQALALQKVMQKVIRAVEPSIACILVSRSAAYRRGIPAGAETSGQLGGFDLSAIDYPAGLSKDDREAFRKKLDLADPTHVPESFGSGVVIDAQGLILTNYHVVQGATKIFVRLPGERSSYADIHAADPRSDLA